MRFKDKVGNICNDKQQCVSFATSDNVQHNPLSKANLNQFGHVFKCLSPSVPGSRRMQTDRDSRKQISLCRGNDRVSTKQLIRNLSCNCLTKQWSHRQSDALKLKASNKGLLYYFNSRKRASVHTFVILQLCRYLGLHTGQEHSNIPRFQWILWRSWW